MAHFSKIALNSKLLSEVSGSGFDNLVCISSYQLQRYQNNLSVQTAVYVHVFRQFQRLSFSLGFHWRDE